MTNERLEEVVTTFMQAAIQRINRDTVAIPRLRVAHHALMAAADADPKLYQSDDWRNAIVSIGHILGKRPEFKRAERKAGIVK